MVYGGLRSVRTDSNLPLELFAISMIVGNSSTPPRISTLSSVFTIPFFRRSPRIRSTSIVIYPPTECPTMIILMPLFSPFVTCISSPFTPFASSPSIPFTSSTCFPLSPFSHSRLLSQSIISTFCSTCSANVQYHGASARAAVWRVSKPAWETPRMLIRWLRSSNSVERKTR